MAERNTHTYKVTDDVYEKARAKAEKEGGTVANLIECVLVAYSAGLKIQAYGPSGKGVRIKPVKHQ